MGRSRPRIRVQPLTPIRKVLLNHSGFNFVKLRTRRLYKRGATRLGHGVVGFSKASTRVQRQFYRQVSQTHLYSVPFTYFLWTVSSTFKYRYEFPHQLCRHTAPLPFSYEEEFAEWAESYRIDLIRINQTKWASIDVFTDTWYLQSATDASLTQETFFLTQELSLGLAWTYLALTF